MLSFTVTSACRLQHRIQSRLLTENNGKINIHTGFYKLCRNNPDYRLRAVFQQSLYTADCSADMGRTHHPRQMHLYSLIRQTVIQFFRIFSGIYYA